MGRIRNFFLSPSKWCSLALLYMMRSHTRTHSRARTPSSLSPIRPGTTCKLQQQLSDVATYGYALSCFMWSVSTRHASSHINTATNRGMDVIQQG